MVAPAVKGRVGVVGVRGDRGADDVDGEGGGGGEESCSCSCSCSCSRRRTEVLSEGTDLLCSGLRCVADGEDEEIGGGGNEMSGTEGSGRGLGGNVVGNDEDRCECDDGADLELDDANELDVVLDATASNVEAGGELDTPDAADDPVALDVVA